MHTARHEPLQARSLDLGGFHPSFRQLVVRPAPTSPPPAGHHLPRPDEPGGRQPTERRVDRALGEPLPSPGRALDAPDELTPIARAIPEYEQERRARGDHA